MYAKYSTEIKSDLERWQSIGKQYLLLARNELENWKKEDEFLLRRKRAKAALEFLKIGKSYFDMCENIEESMKPRG